PLLSNGNGCPQSGTRYLPSLSESRSDSVPAGCLFCCCTVAAKRAMDRLPPSGSSHWGYIEKSYAVDGLGARRARIPRSRNQHGERRQMHGCEAEGGRQEGVGLPGVRV